MGTVKLPLLHLKKKKVGTSSTTRSKGKYVFSLYAARLVHLIQTSMDGICVIYCENVCSSYIDSTYLKAYKKILPGFQLNGQRQTVIELYHRKHSYQMGLTTKPDFLSSHTHHSR